MILYTLSLVGIVIAGTVLHELTHYVVALALGAKVTRVRWFPPNPFVEYRAPSERVDGLIRASTVVASVPIAVCSLLAVVGQPIAVKLAALAFIVMYVPRSRTDWSPILELELSRTSR